MGGEQNRAMLEQLRELPVDEAVRSLAAALDTGSARHLPPSRCSACSQGTPPSEDVLGAPGVRERLLAMLKRARRAGQPRPGPRTSSATPSRSGASRSRRSTPRRCFLYGGEDATVGRQHGEWYAARLPDSRLKKVVPGRGHLSPVSEWERVLAFLLPEPA